MAWLLLPWSGAAQEDGWSNESELSFVQTGGNASASTLGLANALTRRWSRTVLKVEVGGIRAKTTDFVRTAVGTAESYRVMEASETRTSAEKYHVRGRVDQTIGSHMTLFLRGGWVRNVFAGVENRYVSVLGISNEWKDEERHKFSTGYGLSYTKQEDVVTDPEASERFVGFQLSADYMLKVTDNTGWTSTASADGNAEETDDFRVDWVNSVSVAMNSRLALRTTFQLLFDNRPSLIDVPLVGLGGESSGMVAVPLDEFDRVFTVALVVTL